MGNKRGGRLAKALALAGMAICLVQVGRAWEESARHKAQQEKLKEMVTKAAQYPIQNMGVPQEITVSPPPDPAEEDGESGDVQQTEEPPAILEKYAGLYEENADLVGWLSIEGMVIDYPVMQNEDDKYYLHHDFYGQDSKYGCLYVKEQADLDDGTNFIIYGHNMRDGSMFGDLDFYLKESFYEEHSRVSFDTLYEERVYEIVAVFRSQVYNIEDEVFKYYQFYQADTREEFDAFYSNIKELSLYDTGVEAQFGDTFLTLSTCASHVEDGRLVVVAKRAE